MPSRGRAFVPENVKGFTTCKAGAHASLLPLSSESQGGGHTTAVSTVCHQVDLLLERDLLGPGGGRGARSRLPLRGLPLRGVALTNVQRHLKEIRKKGGIHLSSRGSSIATARRAIQEPALNSPCASPTAEQAASGYPTEADA